MDNKTRFFLWKYSLAKKGAIKKFQETITNQHLSNSDLEELQFRKFKSIFEYAYNYVPYYKKKFNEAGISPSDIKSRIDIEKVPILTRKEIVDNFDDFFSIKCKRNELKISTTGGSTGTPLKVGFTKKIIREIPKWRMLNWWGLQPNTNMATFYRGLVKSLIHRIVVNLIYYPQRIIQFDATNIKEENIIDFIKSFNKIKPDLIHGYVGALDVVADYILEHNIKLKHSPKVIWATAAPITKIQEEKISKAFNSPICDQYGCSELYFIAAECPKKEGLHIFADDVLVEILRDDNSIASIGETGKVTVTNLNEYNFPLIRYQNGDESKLLEHKCSCGMNLPLMGKVKGRISEKIKMPNGTILTGEYLTCLFDDYTDEVKQFQVIQRKDSSIDVNIMFHTTCNNKDFVINKTIEELISRVGYRNLIRVQEVDHIENTKGKLRFIISEL